MKLAFLCFGVAVILGLMQGMEEIACAWLCLASFYAGTNYHKYIEQEEEN